jgi:predicted enzyme related to lactoylglutathione lyase
MTTTTTPATSTIVGVDIFGPPTRDAKTLIAFYRDVLGMAPTAIDESQSGAEFELSDGTTFGIWQPPQPPAKAAGYSALFAVHDINAAVAEFRARGAQLGDPYETPVCFMSFGHDPEGNMFGIHQRKTTG